MTNEAPVQQEIRLALGREPTLRLFRNNNGVLRNPEGRPVRFGLFPGSGDLIGWRTITITPEMVGQQVAIFSSVEVKRPRNAKEADEQHIWIGNVQRAGGYAGFARSPEEARLIVKLHGA